MLSWLSISVSLTICLSTAGAQEFIPLSDYTGYSSLEACQTECLENNNTRYDDLTAAENNCETLNDQLNAVSSCIANGRNAVAPCHGNSTAVLRAQSVLAAYCTSEIGLKRGIIVPATTVVVSTGSADAGVVTSSDATLAAATATDAVDGVTTPTNLGSGGSGVPSASITASPSVTPSTGSPSTATTSTVMLHQVSKQGLSSGEKAGIGVGIGLGLPIIIGAIAAWWFMNKRKKSRAAGGPYGPVLTSEKRRPESGSYSSPPMEAQEMHPMSNAVPFLPAAARHHQDTTHHEDQWEPTPTTAVSRDLPYSDARTPIATHHDNHGPPQQDRYNSLISRPATSRDVSRGGTPPPPLNMQARPATAHARLAPPDDEPPSPISPVSPVSPVGSRPPSFRHSMEHHE
ncbi:hypothetical protein LTR53_006285 [Teratosphaeriaceae sp. CCFEE 6253]|nr:hypothetical protein LTR53_006285 [Teratosphaeriaceae sp. CCFEE 6253]